MSVQNLYASAAPWIITVLGLTLIATISFSAIYPKGYQDAAEYYNIRNTRIASAEDVFDLCKLKKNVDEAIYCVYNFKNNTFEQHLQQDNLIAQKEIAYWSKNMFWTTLTIGSLTVLITSIGAWWVWKTLVESRKSVKTANDAVTASREIGQSQTRAWIQITGSANEKLATKRMREQDFVTPFKLTFGNIGHTPALMYYVIDIVKDSPLYDGKYYANKIRLEDFPSELKFILMPNEKRIVILLIELKDGKYSKVSNSNIIGGDLDPNINFINASIIITVIYEAAGKIVIGKTVRRFGVKINLNARADVDTNDGHQHYQKYEFHSYDTYEGSHAE